MVTLEAILRRPFVGRAPVLSCMLATGWRTVTALARGPLDRAGMLAWIEQPHWAARLREFLAARDAT
jgi:maleate isomerase